MVRWLVFVVVNLVKLHEEHSDGIGFISVYPFPVKSEFNHTSIMARGTDENRDIKRIHISYPRDRRQ